MSLKTATRVAQKKMVATFRWTFADTMEDINALLTELGTNVGESVVDGAAIFEVINQPVNAVVTSGRVHVKTAFDTAGYDIIVGDSGDADRHMATVDAKAAGVYPFDFASAGGSGYKNVGGLNIRMSIASDDVCTTGEALLVVEYIIEDRAEELNPN